MNSNENQFVVRGNRLKICFMVYILNKENNEKTTHELTFFNLKHIHY